MTAQRRAAVTPEHPPVSELFHPSSRSQELRPLLVTRRAERFEELAAELRQAHGVRCGVLAADLTEPAATGATVAHADEVGLQVDLGSPVPLQP